MGVGRIGSVALVVVVAMLSWWVNGSLTVGAGLDHSWEIGLSLAVARGLAFGRQVVFTFGPLGLVVAPQAVTAGTLALGLLGAAVMWLALVAVVLRALLRLFAWPIAGLIGIVALNIIAPAGVPLDEIAFGLAAFALAASLERARRAFQTLAVLGGVIAGLALLVKLNDGIGATAIIAVGLMGGVNRPRHIAMAAVTLVLTALLAWLALGQPISALPDYVRTGRSIVEGYVDAMGFNWLGGGGGRWELVVLIASALVLSAGAWLALAEAPLRRRVALAGCVLLVHYFVGREIFVRAGRAEYMALLLAVALLIPWRRGQRVIGSAISVGLAVVSLVALGTVGFGLGSVLDPFGRAHAVLSDIGTMTSPGTTIERGRRTIEQEDAVPPSIVAAFDGHCVNAEPVEIAAIFAYRSWRWCPIGAMQSYLAYTTELDNLDAAGYANAHTGPDRVLRQGGASDGRNAIWESPAAMLALLCHFKEIGRGGQWQALARIPDRCGRPRLLGTVHSSGHDATLQVPPAPPGSVLIAQVHGLQIGARERLETLFTRAAVRALIVNGTNKYRVVPDTLTDGLILDVPAYADYRAPFKLNLDVRSLTARIKLHYDTQLRLRYGMSVPISATLLAVPIKRA
jgi:hypothetical protein